MNFKWMLFSISFAFLSSPLCSQVNTFNKGFLFLDTLMQESVNQLIEVDDGYLVGGFSDFLRTKMIISKLDYNGDTIWLKKYGDDSLFFQPGYQNAMIRTRDSEFAMAVNFTDFGGDYKSRMMIIKFNSEGDTLWSNLLYVPDSTQRHCIALGIIETYDKGFLVFGNENYLSGVLIKTDSLGRKEWMKYYGNYLTADSRQITDVRQTSDSGFIAAGYQRNLHDIRSGDARVIKFDKYGNITWDKVFGSSFQDYIGACIQPVNDTEFVVVAHLTTLTSGEPHFFPQGGKLNIIHITDHGNIVENYQIGNDENMPMISDLEVMQDGSLIGCGSDNYGSISWIWNFSLDQDSIFFRMINPENYPGTFRYLNDIKGTSDGGIIVSGEYSTVINSEYIRHPWVFKTDRFGCIEMGCDSTAIYITDQPEPGYACKNAEYSLNIAAVSIPGNIGYFWQKLEDQAWMNLPEGNVYQGVQSDILYINCQNINYLQETYRCNFYNDFWSFYSDSVVVNFLDTLAIVSQPQSNTVNYGESAHFEVNTTGTPPVSFQWYHNEEILVGEIDSVLFLENVNESDTGMYFCRMGNDCGNLESDPAFLKISNLGVGDDQEQLEIGIYPNPTDGILNLWTDEKIFPGNMKLLDITGRPITLKVKKYTDQNLHLDLRGISPGVYFLVIQFEGQGELVRKVIRN